MKLNRTLAILLIPIFILSACSKKHPKEKGPVIAKIGNEYLYLYDMITPSDSLRFSDKGASFKRNRVEVFIMRYLYAKLGYSDGIHKKESIQEQLTNHINKSMINVVYKKAVLDKFVNEKTMRDLYGRLQGQISGRHILISYADAESNPKDVSRSKSDALQLIGDIRGRIASRDDFISLADELSEDPTSTDGGNIGFFKWDDMEDSFQEVAFSLPVGSVSEPVETSYGYHIIWIDSIRTVDYSSFARMERGLNRRLSNTHKDEIIQAGKDFINSLNSAAGTELYDDRIESLSVLMLEYVQSDSSYMAGITPVVFLEEAKSIGPLATYDGKDVTTQILIGLIKDPKTGWTIASLTDTSTIKNLVVNEINKKLITEYGYTNKFDNDKSMTEDLKKQERGYVWQEIKKLNIEDRIDDKEENLLKYYNEYKDNYVSKRTSDILEILVSEKTLADSLYSLAMSGGDMESLALEFSERSTAKKNNGIIEGVTSKRLGPIGKQAAMMNVGDISKPLKAGNKWSIFKILSAVPPRYISFSEAKSRLIVDFKKEEIKRLTEEFGRYLINKYNPHYYFENINAQVATSEIE